MGIVSLPISPGGHIPTNCRDAATDAANESVTWRFRKRTFETNFTDYKRDLSIGGEWHEMALRLLFAHRRHARKTIMEAMNIVHNEACEPEAVMQAVRSHEEAFAAVLSGYLPRLYRLALRKLGNPEDAEDALQDALLLAFKNLGQFRGQAQLTTWLSSIVLNSARMKLRSGFNRRILSLDETYEEGQPAWADKLEDSAPDAEEVFRRTEARETLEKLVGKLPARLRSAFRLCVFEELSTREAAMRLGIGQGTLKARFFRARRQMTTLMREAANPSHHPKDDTLGRQATSRCKASRERHDLCEQTPEVEEFACA
jgi:RNA polymerase sigma-70 factor (ECF subfamily)